MSEVMRKIKYFWSTQVVKFFNEKLNFLALGENWVIVEWSPHKAATEQIFNLDHQTFTNYSLNSFMIIFTRFPSVAVLVRKMSRRPRIFLRRWAADAVKGEENHFNLSRNKRNYFAGVKILLSLALRTFSLTVFHSKKKHKHFNEFFPSPS